MSQKYSGGFITKSPVAPTTSAASGIWTLDQQQQAQKAGTWPSPPLFIEDLFSTYLYTGTGATQTITNNIDLSGQGGLVWIKRRDSATNHQLADTVRGATKYIYSNLTDPQDTVSTRITSFNSDGFSLGSNVFVNNNTFPFVSWTFRKQPKFFDIVTWTGNGSGDRVLNHNLASTPGCIIIKATNVVDYWYVYHTSLGTSKYLNLDRTDSQQTGTVVAAVSSTTFTAASGSGLNTTDTTYVAYLFANDAGGFPVSGGGSTNGISCGSFTIDGSGKFTVSLGYEPQWILIKGITVGSNTNWSLFDNMRGMPVGSNTTRVLPNSDAAESTAFAFVDINATGFAAGTGGSNPYTNGDTFIYIAIRRGPMKTPTVGTSVFSPEVQTPTAGANNNMAANSGFPIDWLPTKQTGNVNSWYATTRITNNYLSPNTTAAEGAYTYGFDRMAGVGGGSFGWDAQATVSYAFKRAPSFFDVVCYTGTEVSGQTFTHNLGVVPEMMIVKSRSGTTDWTAYHSALGASARIYPNATNAANTGTAAPWNSTTPTSSVFSLGNAGATNLSGATFVNYLFATLAGISKVGSYTGTGALQTVNCGFTSGARFVLIKRTDSTGDWYTYDSARGITSGNDPYLFLNSTAAEVTGTNYVDTDTTGFKVTAAAPAGLNANGGTYIFLAIA